MADVNLPPCGIYRTGRPIGEIPGGRLVYFHNHGDPGPGVYLPQQWQGNRAIFSERGTTLTDPSAAAHLEPLEPEGFYRVASPFHCCAQRCRMFEEDALVQLGYDGEANPILFTPEIVDGAVAIPTRGTRIDRERTSRLQHLKVPITHRTPTTH